MSLIQVHAAKSGGYRPQSKVSRAELTNFTIELTFLSASNVALRHAVASHALEPLTKKRFQNTRQDARTVLHKHTLLHSTATLNQESAVW